MTAILIPLMFPEARHVAMSETHENPRGAEPRTSTDATGKSRSAVLKAA